MQAVQALSGSDLCVFADYKAAQAGAAALRRAVKRKALRESEPQPTPKRAKLLFARPEDATVDIGDVSFPVYPPPVGSYYKDASGRPVPYITDSEAEHAALRASLSSDTPYGPTQEWAALVDMDGKVCVQIFRGPLSDLRKMIPCEMDRHLWELAGADLAGTAKPIQVERYHP